MNKSSGSNLNAPTSNGAGGAGVSKMIKAIRPLGNQVLLGPLPADTKSSGGILYPPQYAIDEKRWFVCAVGPKVEDVKPGDRVFVEMTGCNRKPVEDGTGRMLFDCREIIAVVEKV